MDSLGSLRTLKRAVKSLTHKNKEADFKKHPYLNTNWYDMRGSTPFDLSASHLSMRSSLTPHESSPLLVPIRNCEDVVAYSGYLMKKQSRVRTNRVQRWFVLAPPFLLCYKTASKAKKDFSKTFAMPHHVTRSMLLVDSGVQINKESELQDLGFLEFEVVTKDKTWNLQASNEDDLKRWISALSKWTS